MPNPVDEFLSLSFNPAVQEKPPPPPDTGRGPIGDFLRDSFDPVGGYVRDKARAGAAYSDVAGVLKQSGVDLGPQGEQFFNLEAARGKHAGEEEGLDYLARRLPGGGAIGQAARDVRYNRVVEKYKQGDASKEDLDFLARYERIREIDAERESTTAGAVVNKLSYAPATVGEFYLTRGLPLGAAGRGLVGANVVRPAIQAQLMPSMTAKTAGERVAQQGGAIYDPQNLGPAAVMSALNNVVLHNVGTAGRGLSLPGRVAAGTAAGMAGQQGVDILGGAVDQVTPQAYATKTKFGILGHILRGENDDALKAAASQAVMFAAFSALPGQKPREPWQDYEVYRPDTEALVARPPDAGRPSGRPGIGGRPGGPGHPVYDAFAEMVDDLAGTGRSRNSIGAEALRVGEWFQKAAADNPVLTRTEAKAQFAEAFKSARPKTRAFGEVVADTIFPESIVRDVRANPPAEPPPEGRPSPEALPARRQALEAAKPEPAAEPEGLPSGGALIEFGDPARPQEVRRTFFQVAPSGRLQIDIAGLGRETEPLGGAMKGGRDLVRDMPLLLEAIKDKGLGIEYSTEDTRGKAFAKRLKAAGFEQVGEPEVLGHKFKKYTWEPVAQKGRAAEGVAAEKQQGAAQVEPETAQSASESRLAQEAAGPTKTPAKPLIGRQATPGREIPAMTPEAWNEVAQKAKLSDRDSDVLKSLLSYTGPEVGRQHGVSKQRISQIVGRAADALGVPQKQLTAAFKKARFDRALDAVAKGDDVRIADFTDDPREMAGAARAGVKHELTQIEIENQSGREMDALIKELEDAGDAIEPERLAQIAARFEVLQRAEESRTRPPREEPASVPAEVSRPPAGQAGEAAITAEATRRTEALTKKRKKIGGKDVELQGGIPGAREVFDFSVKALTWLAKTRMAVPRVPIQFDMTHILPRWGNYADWKAAFSTPEGIGRVPVLARLFDPRGVAFEPVDRSLIARAAAVENGKTLAALWGQSQQLAKQHFPAFPDGTFQLVGNRRGYLADVIEAELKRPGSQPLTPEQRSWVENSYKPLLDDLQDMLSTEGVKGWVDPQGNPSPLSKHYFPRPAIGKEGFPTPSEAGAPPLGASAPGAKSFFQKSRQYATEEAGAKAGVQYDPDPISRVTKMIAGAYRAVADHRLANDPDLGAMPAADHVWLETRPVNVAPAFQGKVFPVEIARRLESSYGQARNPMIRLAESTAALAKGLVLGLDASVPFNQGLVLLFRRPDIWGRAFGRMWQSMFDPLVMAKQLQRPENMEAAREFVQAGGTLGRLTDFAAGLEQGEAATKVPIVGKGYAIAGRMMGVFLDLSKLYQWQSWRTVTPPDQRASMVQAIENSVFAGRMESVGVEPWRALGERLLFLAPSYYRGGLGLVATSFQRGAAGRFARQSIGAFLLGLTATAVAGMFAAGLSEDEVLQRLNPAKGKFLKVPVRLGDGSSVEVGFGNILISFARLLGTIIDSFGDDKPIDTGVDGDPILRWYRGHAGTIPRFAIDIFTGKDFQGNRSGVTESAAKSVEPLATQTLLHGEGGVFEKGVGDPHAPKMANVADAAASLLGLQSYPGNAGAEYHRVLNDQARTQFGKDFERLSLREQASVIKTVKQADAAPKKPDPSPALIERAMAAQVDRQKRITGKLSDEARRNLSALGQTVPGYEATMQVNGVSVPLTQERMVKLEGFLVEEYNRSAAQLPVERLRQLNAEQRKKVVQESLGHARERARHRLLAAD